MAAILIAGTSSGVGKTTISLGLTRSLANGGHRVRPFKVGPDFLDPLHLRAAAGTTCYNLDSWMTSPDYVRSLFTTTSADGDVSVIEGVMGMFDGFSPVGMAGSIAPLVQGFVNFEPSVRIPALWPTKSPQSWNTTWISTPY